ncbi:hypothetical protein [Nocardia beijingensis]|uniref:hypothetical protein n=1 Tax=Nocardia beijingensis TaxID=95162 RepID=UPI0033BF73C0
MSLTAATTSALLSDWLDMFEHFAPHATELDVVIRIHWTDVGGQCLDLFYRSGFNAAWRFITEFNATRADGTASMLASSAALLLPRLPCERNWAIP